MLKFFSIWSIFIVSFGIVLKAISKPDRYGEAKVTDIFEVVSMTYWQNYGELFLEQLKDDADRVNGIS